MLFKNKQITIEIILFIAQCNDDNTNKFNKYLLKINKFAKVNLDRKKKIKPSKYLPQIINKQTKQLYKQNK